MAKEIPMKQWLAEEAQRESVTTRAIWNRLKGNKYPNVKLRRVNQRVVFVTEVKP